MAPRWKKEDLQCHRDIPEWDQKWQIIYWCCNGLIFSCTTNLVESVWKNCFKIVAGTYWQSYYDVPRPCRLWWKMGRGRQLSACFQSFRRTVTLDVPTPAGSLTQPPLLDDRRPSLSTSSVRAHRHISWLCSHPNLLYCFCWQIRFLVHRPPLGDAVSAASDCNRRSKGSLHLLCFGQSWNYRIQV